MKLFGLTIPPGLLWGTGSRGPRTAAGFISSALRHKGATIGFLHVWELKYERRIQFCHRVVSLAKMPTSSAARSVWRTSPTQRLHAPNKISGTWTLHGDSNAAYSRFIVRIISAEIGHKSSLVSASAQPYHFSNVLLHVFEKKKFWKNSFICPIFLPSRIL